MKTIHTSLILATALLVALSPTRVNAQSAAISFQGQLGDGGRPATGQYDFVFRLFDAASGGAEQAQAIALNNRGVTNGYFTVPLDFGIAAYAVVGVGASFKWSRDRKDFKCARRAPRCVRGNLAADRDDTGAVCLVCPQWQCRTQGRQR